MPAIIPTALVICAGWREIFRLLNQWTGLSPSTGQVLLPVFMFGLDLFTILAILIYFYPRLLDAAYLILFMGMPVFFLMGWRLARQKLAAAGREE